MAVDGVHGICSYSSINRPGLRIDVVLIEGDAATVQADLAAAVDHPAEPIVVAGFDVIVPLHYPWVADFENSTSLPRTVA